MSEAGETREFVLSLRPGPGGTPRGTLRAVGDRDGTAFEGWIGLIGVITAWGFAADGGDSRAATPTTPPPPVDG